MCPQEKQSQLLFSITSSNYN